MSWKRAGENVQESQHYRNYMLLAERVAFASVLKQIFPIIGSLCHFYYLFCCLAHTGPELDLGPYVWKAQCSLLSFHASCSFNKTVPFFNIQND